MSLFTEVSVFAQDILSHISSVSAEVAGRVNVPELEASVERGLETGQGLSGVLTTVLLDAPRIFNLVDIVPVTALLSSTQELVAKHP